MLRYIHSPLRWSPLLASCVSSMAGSTYVTVSEPRADAHIADNVRSMNNTADTVSELRTLDGLRQAPPPERLPAWTNAPRTVVLNWFDAAANEAGYQIEWSVNGRGNSRCSTTREAGMG